MAIWTFLLAVYVAGAVLALWLTLRERLIQRDWHFRWTLLGLLACLAWPAVVLLVGVMANRGRAAA